jgi:hypothetical protein
MFVRGCRCRLDSESRRSVLGEGSQGRGSAQHRQRRLGKVVGSGSAEAASGHMRGARPAAAGRNGPCGVRRIRRSHMPAAAPAVGKPEVRRQSIHGDDRPPEGN